MTSFTPGRPPDVSLMKRTRTNVRQSKHGCLTCRARKVKCDETKPTCLRCHQASKHCGGYTVRAASKHGHNTVSTDVAVQPQPSGLTDIAYPVFSRRLSNRRYLSSQDACYSRLGLEVLLQQSHEKAQWDDQPSWIQLVAQLLPSNDAVSGAIVSLGATYEAQCLQLSGIPPRHTLTRYQNALAALQREIAHLHQGPVPIFLASILLAAVEVLQRRLIIATMHLQGAFKALASLKPHDQLHRADTGHPGRNFDSLYFLAQSLDLQTAWYALGNPPRLPQSFDLADGIDPADHLVEDEASVRSLLHSCYHFTSKAAKFKYCRQTKTPSSLILEQSHYIAALTDWLAPSSHSTRISNGSVNPESLVLKVQVLSTLIYVCTILSAYEAAYDLYAAHFQQILDIAGEVLAASKETAPPSISHFQFQPGIFQAIFFTAMKCRDPELRRRAVNLCGRVGTEGPWDPRVMIPVAQRAIEVEEVDLLRDPVDGHMQLPIPETQRLHGCGMDSSAPEGKLSNRVQATFSLCKSVEHMLQSDDHEDQEHWIIWTEHLETTGYSKPRFH